MIQYLQIVENIIREGINDKEIINVDPETIASEIFSTTCISLINNIKREEKIDIVAMYKKLEQLVFNGLLR